MADYRRQFVPGGIYFFTLVTRNRAAVFDTPFRVAALREAMRSVQQQRPFSVHAIVVLPDHIHAIWQLPESDCDFSNRWREIKKRVTRALGHAPGQTWQRRFWEHLIRDEEDWRRHMDYIHYNPVKHGHAAHPSAWPWSSFSTCVERGWYPPDWGSSEPPHIRSMDIE